MKNSNFLKFPILLFILLSLFIQSCSEDKPDDQNQDSYENLEFFYTNANSLRLDVAYEAGAAPYTNTGFGSNNNFEFTANNLSDLFADRGNPISVFTDLSLADMTSIPAQNKSSYSQSEIRELAEAYQPVESSENQGVIFVLFLDGYYNSNGQELTNVLGVSVGSFVVALFKPVIAAVPGGGVLGGDPKPQVEQATIVHEVGHAIGLVDNGVALHTDHLDEANGKHCDNQNCVMYWANEGAGGLSNLFGGASATELVFGQECKGDITNF